MSQFVKFDQLNPEEMFQKLVKQVSKGHFRDRKDEITAVVVTLMTPQSPGVRARAR